MSIDWIIVLAVLFSIGLLLLFIPKRENKYLRDYRKYDND